jgi:hypothetical protein
VTAFIACAVVSYAQDADTTADDDCSLSAPDAILLEGAYTNHSFTRVPYHGAIERADIGNGVSLEVRLSSCEDSVYERLSFEIEDRSKQYDVARSLRLARSMLTSLKVNDDGAAIVKGIQVFLSKAKARDVRNGRISVCRDGSVQDKDGCSWSSGGGYVFEVTKRQGGATIVVSRDVSH